MSIDQTNKPRGWTHIAERFQHSFDQVWAHVPKVRRNEAGHDKLGFTLYSSYCAWRLPGSRLFRTKKINICDFSKHAFVSGCCFGAFSQLYGLPPFFPPKRTFVDRNHFYRTDSRSNCIQPQHRRCIATATQNRRRAFSLSCRRKLTSGRLVQACTVAFARPFPVVEGGTCAVAPTRQTPKDTNLTMNTTKKQ